LQPLHDLDVFIDMRIERAEQLDGIAEFFECDAQAM
jgi:hypothetical protein